MGYGQADQTDREMMALALQQARISLDGGGVPVGAVLAAGGQLIAAGHNERVQRGDPVAHGEIACLRNAGRRPSYLDTTLYTTLPRARCAPAPSCSSRSPAWWSARPRASRVTSASSPAAASRSSCSTTTAAWPPCRSSRPATPKSGAKTSAAASPLSRGI